MQAWRLTWGRLHRLPAGLMEALGVLLPRTLGHGPSSPSPAPPLPSLVCHRPQAPDSHGCSACCALPPAPAELAQARQKDSELSQQTLHAWMNVSEQPGSSGVRAVCLCPACRGCAASCPLPPPPHLRHTAGVPRCPCLVALLSRFSSRTLLHLLEPPPCLHFLRQLPTAPPAAPAILHAAGPPAGH